MVEFGNKHGGNSVQSRTPFLVDGCQNQQRVESFYHYFCTSVSQTVHCGEHYTEAVEERHADAKFVICREFHVFARQETIVGDVVVCQHYSLGESGSSRSVLHVHGIVTAYFLLGFFQFFVINVLSQQQDFCRVIHAAVFFLSDIDYVAHVREALALQVSALEGLEFGQHGVRHVNETAVFFSVHDTQGMHIRVLAEIFQFGLFVVGVYRNGYGTDLGTCIEECQPVGYIPCPDTDMGSFFHADAQQAFCQVIYSFVKLFPGKPQVAVGVNNVFFVGSGCSPVFTPVSQSTF